MKTKEELDAIKEEVEMMKKKLKELNEEELKQVVGGDIAYYNSMAEQCRLEMQNCIEQNIDAQTYRNIMSVKIQAYVNIGYLMENEAKELLALVDDYSRRLRNS